MLQSLRTRAERNSTQAPSEPIPKPVGIRLFRKPIELADFDASFSKIIDPERSATVLSEPVAALVESPEELIVLHPTAKQAALPDGVRVASATGFGKRYALSVMAGVGRLHQLFSAALERLNMGCHQPVHPRTVALVRRVQAAPGDIRCIWAE